MKNITVFLASSDELKNDRNSFHSLVASLDEIFEPRGYRIRCRRWEDFSAFCTGTRTQDDYNRIVRASDICICMFHRKAGEYTICHRRCHEVAFCHAVGADHSIGIGQRFRNRG